jgi:YHS domain-containing protein
MANDPICNMEVDEESAEFKVSVWKHCSEECKKEFESRPEHYAAAA